MGDVLLLDDDPDLLEAISDLLGFATTGKIWRARSLAELQRLAPAVLGCELAILDINLGPGVPGGLEAMRWLSAQSFAGRVVFLTGHARGYPGVEEAMAAAGVQVLSKPASSEALLGLLASAG